MLCILTTVKSYTSKIQKVKTNCMCHDYFVYCGYISFCFYLFSVPLQNFFPKQIIHDCRFKAQIDLFFTFYSVLFSFSCSLCLQEVLIKCVVFRTFMPSVESKPYYVFLPLVWQPWRYNTTSLVWLIFVLNGDHA